MPKYTYLITIVIHNIVGYAGHVYLGHSGPTPDPIAIFVIPCQYFVSDFKIGGCTWNGRQTNARACVRLSRTNSNLVIVGGGAASSLATTIFRTTWKIAFQIKPERQ